MNKEYKDYLKSKEWSDIKVDLYLSRGKKCERCGSSKFLHVHHKHYRNIFKEEPQDLEILCSSCHRREHGIGEGAKTVSRNKRFVKTKKQNDIKARMVSRKNKRNKQKAWKNKMLSLCISEKEKASIRGHVVPKKMSDRLMASGVFDHRGRLKRELYRL